MKTKKWLALLIAGLTVTAAGLGLGILQADQFTPDYLIAVEEEEVIEARHKVVVKATDFSRSNIIVTSHDQDAVVVKRNGLVHEGSRISYDNTNEAIKVNLSLKQPWYQVVFQLDHSNFLYDLADLEVFIPNTVDTLVVTNSSQKIEIKDVNLDYLEVRNSSSAITLNNLIVNDLSITNASGNIYCEEVAATTATIKNRSGSIKITNTTAAIDSLVITNNSGSINVMGVFQKIQATNSSAATIIEPLNKAAQVRVVSSSGSIRFRSNSSYTYFAKVSSGKVRVSSIVAGNVAQVAESIAEYVFINSSASIYLEPNS